MNKLALVSLHEVKALQPAAMYEADAAKYLGISRPTFRDLLFSGAISYVEHAHGKTRVFLRSDLDEYLSSLPKRKMAGRKPVEVLHGGASE